MEPVSAEDEEAFIKDYIERYGRWDLDMTDHQSVKQRPTQQNLGLRTRQQIFSGSYAVFDEHPPSSSTPIVANCALSTGRTLRYLTAVHHPPIEHMGLLGSLRRVRTHKNLTPLELNVVHLLFYRFSQGLGGGIPPFIVNITIEMETDDRWRPIQRPLRTATVRVEFAGESRARRVGVVGMPYVQMNGVRAPNRMSVSFPSRLTTLQHVQRGDGETVRSFGLRVGWSGLDTAARCVNEAMSG